MDLQLNGCEANGCRYAGSMPVIMRILARRRIKSQRLMPSLIKIFRKFLLSANMKCSHWTGNEFGTFAEKNIPFWCWHGRAVGNECGWQTNAQAIGSRSLNSANSAECFHRKNVWFDDVGHWLVLSLIRLMISITPERAFRIFCQLTGVTIEWRMAKCN